MRSTNLSHLALESLLFVLVFILVVLSPFLRKSEDNLLLVLFVLNSFTAHTRVMVWGVGC